MGSDGEGDGPARRASHPQPANLAEHEYTLDRLSFALWNGIAGTSMPAWRDLSRAGSVRRRRGGSRISCRADRADSSREHPRLGRASLRRSLRAVPWRERRGGTDRPSARLDIVPTNFRAVRPSLAASLRALRNGVEGTPMAPWTGKLSEAELSAVAYYVRGFFQADDADGESMIIDLIVLLVHRICGRVSCRLARGAPPPGLDRAAQIPLSGECAKL